MRTVAVAGAGSIGTSIALALKARGVTTYLRDRDPGAVRIAEALGAGTAAVPPGKVDIAALAVPPAEVAHELAVLQKSAFAPFYTDVASVKALPYANMSRLQCDLTSVVGGHPLVATERSGPIAARADLFEGHPWILVPSEATSVPALNAVLELVALCGATSVMSDAEAHDRAMALVSHGPHAIVSLTTARLLDGDRATLGLAGPAVRDLARVAVGSPGLWADVLSSNAGPVAEVLETFATDVLAFAGELRRQGASRRLTGATPAGGGSALVETLRRGADGCASVPDRYGVPRAALTALDVCVEDVPGALGRLFSQVAEAGGTLEEVKLGPAAGHGAEWARISAAHDRAWDLVTHLRLKGWTVQEAGIVPTGPREVVNA